MAFSPPSTALLFLFLDSSVCYLFIKQKNAKCKRDESKAAVVIMEVEARTPPLSQLWSISLALSSL